MSFCVAGAALETCRVAVSWRIALSVLRDVVTLTTPHSTLHTPHFTTPHFTFYTLRSQFHTFTLLQFYTLHFTLHTPHFTPYTLHSTLYTLHPTLCTVHSTLYTLHHTLYTSLHCTLHTLHSTLCTLHPTLYTLPTTLYTLHSTHYVLHFTLHTSHFLLPALHFALHTLHSFLFSHNYDSGVRYPTCGHSGLWVSSCLEKPVQVSTEQSCDILYTLNPLLTHHIFHVLKSCHGFFFQSDMRYRVQSQAVAERVSSQTRVTALHFSISIVYDSGSRLNTDNIHNV